MRAELFVDARAELAEGPVWDTAEDRLVWVDILAGYVHATTPDGIDTVIWETGTTVGCVAPHSDGSWIVAERDRLTRVTGWHERTELVTLPIPASVRTNDGKLDPEGRMVVGTMAFDATPHAGDPVLLGRRHTAHAARTGHHLQRSRLERRRDHPLLHRHPDPADRRIRLPRRQHPRRATRRGHDRRDRRLARRHDHRRRRRALGRALGRKPGPPLPARRHPRRDRRRRRHQRQQLHIRPRRNPLHHHRPHRLTRATRRRRYLPSDHRRAGSLPAHERRVQP